MVHVSGKHGSRNRASCTDGEEQPWYPADAGASGRHREAMSCKICDSAVSCGSPDGYDGGNVLSQRRNRLLDSGVRIFTGSAVCGKTCFRDVYFCFSDDRILLAAVCVYKDSDLLGGSGVCVHCAVGSDD